MAGAEVILQTLISRGWSFRDPHQITELVQNKADLEPGTGIKELTDVIESELLNSDIRSLGGKSLPDTANLRRLSHIQGPKVLQVVSTRDLYQSCIDASFQNSHRNERLLRFILTDGNSEITAIEYTPIPFISEEIAPGSKVCLENKITVHNGILCLNPKVLKVMGGVVDSLYEEWQLEQKYSGVSGSVSRRPITGDGAGPPPFEKLQLGKQSSRFLHQHKSHASLSVPPVSDNSRSRFNDIPGETSQGHLRELAKEPTLNSVHDTSSSASTSKNIDESTGTSTGRAKEVIEVMPIQNQAAAQKLLQKMVQPNRGKRPSRGRSHRFKDDDAPVFTLEEWENRKAGTSKHAPAGGMLDVSRDEEIARQLQRQMDLEDFQARESNVKTSSEAEMIKMSMFNFHQEEQKFSGRTESRGRGRGRGRKRFG